MRGDAQLACQGWSEAPAGGQGGRRPGEFGLRVLSSRLPPCDREPVARGRQNGRNPAKQVASNKKRPVA